MLVFATKRTQAAIYRIWHAEYSGVLIIFFYHITI